jgi:hypothetical protein
MDFIPVLCIANVLVVFTNNYYFEGEVHVSLVCLNAVFMFI